jgi:hypothetical protein
MNYAIFNNFTLKIEKIFMLAKEDDLPMEKIPAKK